MAASVAVVGPGRVGSALARRFVAGGLRLVGFHARDPARAARAVAFAGAGEVLPTLTDLRRASAVLLAVPESALPEVVASALAAHAVRPCALWFHASGRVGLADLQPLALAGARIGALHPLCPVPAADVGARLLEGRHATLLGDERALRLLHVLARKAGLVPWVDPGLDRVRYHAAAALAANGVTALVAAVARAFRAAAPPGAVLPSGLAEGLMAPALALCTALGPAAALSGPVRRGDAATVVAQVRALEAEAPELATLYRVLMREALRLACTQGLAADAAAAVARALLAEDLW